MKIGLVSNMYPSKDDSKYGIFVKGIVSSLEKIGCKIVFYSVIKGKRSGKINKILAYSKLYFHALFSILFRKSDLIYLHYPLHLAPLVYFINNFTVTPLVINFHGTDLVPKRPWLLRMEKLLKKSISSVEIIVVPSQFLKNEVSEKYGVPENKIFVSPSGGVNFDVFKRFNDNPATEKEYAAGFVSRIEKEKGWEIFIKALKELKNKDVLQDRKFVIAGTGSQEKELLQMVKEFKLEENITIKKVSDQSELPSYFNAIDVFIFPSLRESLGLVGLEAMACGTPVIGSLIGGISDYLKDGGNGFFFKVGDHEDLADKMENYLKMTKVEKMKLKDNALVTAEDYDRERIAVKLLQKFKSIYGLSN